MWMFFILSICAKFFIKKGASAPFFPRCLSSSSATAVVHAAPAHMSARPSVGASRASGAALNFTACQRRIHQFILLHMAYHVVFIQISRCSRGLFSFLRFDMQGNKIACHHSGNKNDNKPGDVDAFLSGHFPVYVFHVGPIRPVRTAVHIVCHIIQHSVYHAGCIVLIDPAAGG